MAFIESCDCKHQRISFATGRYKQVKPYGLISSHWAFAENRPLPNYMKDGELITILRNPVDMAMSFFYYFRLIQKDRSHTGLMKSQVSLVDDADGYSRDTMAFNWYVKNYYQIFPSGWFVDLHRFDKIFFWDRPDIMEEWLNERNIAFRPRRSNQTGHKPCGNLMRQSLERKFQEEIRIYNTYKQLHT